MLHFAWEHSSSPLLPIFGNFVTEKNNLPLLPLMTQVKVKLTVSV
jgi:hypothetical protein